MQDPNQPDDQEDATTVYARAFTAFARRSGVLVSESKFALFKEYTKIVITEHDIAKIDFSKAYHVDDAMQLIYDHFEVYKINVW